jgi:hypothetical protein
MFRAAVILFVIFFSTSAHLYADTPAKFEDTRVQDYMDCETIVATHYKTINQNKKTKVKFKECLIKSGGAYFKKETAPRRYFYKEKPFMGAVDRLSTGHVFYLLKDLETERVNPAQGFKDSFTCNQDNTDDDQCMACDCFFKDRDKSFDEQVMLARTTLSQVISPSFSTSACKVVYAPGARQWTEKKSDRLVKSTPNYKLEIGEGSNALSSLHKTQFRRCVRAVKKSVKFKNNFYASHFVGKKEKDPNWLKTCNTDMKKGNVLLSEDDNLINYHDWSYDFYKICTQKENRCLSYDTCKAAVGPATNQLPSKEKRDALLM